MAWPSLSSTPDTENPKPPHPVLVVRGRPYQAAGCMTRCVGHKVMSGCSAGPEVAERGLMTGPSVRAGGAARRNVEGSTHGAIPTPDRASLHRSRCPVSSGAISGPSSAQAGGEAASSLTPVAEGEPSSDSGSFRVMMGDSIGHGRRSLPMGMGAPRVTADGSWAAPVQRRTSKHGLGRGCGCRRQRSRRPAASGGWRLHEGARNGDFRAESGMQSADRPPGDPTVP